MTRPTPPRLASWLLHRCAFGPQRESLVGDIEEQYRQGRSSMWYWRQALTTVVIGASVLVRAQPRRALRMGLLAVSVFCFVATAGWVFMVGISRDNWLTIVFNLGVFGYCAIGLTAPSF